MLERWVRAVLRFRVAVLVAWLLIAAAGAYSSTRLPGLLSNSFAVPGTESDRARAILASAYGELPEGTFTVAFRVRHPSDRGARAQLRRRLDAAARTIPTASAGTLRPGGGVLFAEIATSLDLKHAKRYTDELRGTLRSQRGPPALVTGQPAIQHDLDPVLESDLRRAEAIALPIALLVLVLAFGLSWAVAIPFVFAAGTVGCTLGAVYGIAHGLSLVTWVTNVVELIGLGLAIDYSLLVVHRFREELSRPRPAVARSDRGTERAEVDDAVVRTMATAGRAVVVAGIAVAAGLGLLLLVPVPFVRALGVAGFLLPLVSIAASLSLQPALLSLLGRRGVARAPAPLPAFPWERLAAWVTRRRFAVLITTTALLLAAAAPLALLRLTPGSLSGIPASLESARGYDLLRERVGAGFATPTQVVLDSGEAGRARTRPVRAGADRLADELFRDPEVLLVASGPAAPYVDRTGRYTRVVVVNRHELGEPATRRLVDRIRTRLAPAARLPAGVEAYAGGVPPQGVDFLARAYAIFPWLVGGLLLVTYLVLLRAFRSVVLPVEAVLLNLLTVGAVYGLLVVLFRWGVSTDALGLTRAEEIEGWIPIFLFAVLFGLSMDYEVFLVSRIRESWDRLGDTRLAVAHGLERTGRVITAAAAVMAVAFSGFVFGRVAALQQLGVGLVLAVLLDATVVRALLAPSLMAALGDWNWWLPARVARLARVPMTTEGEERSRPSPDTIAT